MKILTCLKPLVRPVKSPNEQYSNRIRGRIVRFNGVISRVASVGLILISLFTIQFSLLTPFTHAQSECNQPSGDQYNVKEAVDKLNKCAIEKNIFDDKIFNANQIIGTTDSIYALLIGRSQLHQETNRITQGSGALVASGNLVASLYSRPPVSGIEYMAQKFQDFNPVKPVYAQDTSGGIGFSALEPVRDVWKVFRNISYVGFVIVFVVMGFMIMFRAKISPQAVATIQDSIPRITIALILVTFSYAIAGLFIDVMFLILNIIINTLQTSGLLTDNSNVIFEKSVFGIIWGSWEGTFKAVFESISSVISDTLIDLPFGLDNLFGIVGGAIGGIVIAIALLFVMFRVFFMLLMAYVMIIILTMAAPFFFLVQALPGMNGANTWFKQMAANVAIFPAVALMFIFAGIIGGIQELGGVQPQLDHGQIGQFPLIAGDIDPRAIGQLIAIGFLLMTPTVGDLIKRTITGPSQGPGMGAGAGAALGGAAGVAYTATGGRALGGTISGAQRAMGERSSAAFASKIPFFGSGVKAREDQHKAMAGKAGENPPSGEKSS